MSHTRNVRRLAPALAAFAALFIAGSATSAAADAPPPSWTNERVLTCGGQSVRTYLTPAGFGTPFHVVDSSDVIIPKYVVVVFAPGTDPVVTVDVPGFDPTRHDAVHCGYVDPAGLAVDFWGLRS
jgi:hypothetical protein